MDIDLVVETSAMHGQLSTGVPAAIVAARSSLGKRGVAILAEKKSIIPKPVIKFPAWTKKEDNFVETYLGILREEDIAEILGRSEIAVHLRWKRDLGLPAPSRHPDFITANQISVGLGTDVHSVMKLINKGILKGHKLPSDRAIRLVNRVTLLQFIVNPLNWIYFKPERVGMPSHALMRRMGKIYDAEFWLYARRLVKKRQSLWKDEWWSIGKVARYHNVDHHLVNKAIHKGHLKAKDWGNWWILKSHATNPSLRFWTGKGRKGEDKLHLNPHTKAFMILAEAVGLMYSEIAILMEWKEKRVAYLLRRFRREGSIPKIIKENNLKVFHDRKTGETFASWQAYQKRFPRLAILMKSLKHRTKITREESRYINRVKRKAELCKYKAEMPHNVGHRPVMRDLMRL